MRFGSQEGTLTCVFQQLSHEGGRLPPLPPPVHVNVHDASHIDTAIHTNNCVSHVKRFVNIIYADKYLI